MTNVVVKDTGAAGGDDEERRSGMKKIGQIISDWMANRDDNEPVDFFDDIFNADSALEFAVQRQNGLRRIVDPDNNGRYWLRRGGQRRRRFIPIMIRDGQQGVDGKRRPSVQMTISIPKRQGALVDPDATTAYGYQLATDILAVAGVDYESLDRDKKEAVQQYLVAVAFLNRCQ